MASLQPAIFMEEEILKFEQVSFAEMFKEPEDDFI
jgi:hypothetical protein